MVKNVSKSSQKLSEKGKRGRKSSSDEAKKAYFIPIYLKRDESELLSRLVAEKNFSSKSGFLRKCFLDYAENQKAK